MAYAFMVRGLDEEGKAKLDRALAGAVSAEAEQDEIDRQNARQMQQAMGWAGIEGVAMPTPLRPRNP